VASGELPVSFSGSHAEVALDAGATTHAPATTAHGDAGGPSAAATWYPPLRATLLCLAQLYRCVDSAAFGGLGQDALAMCTQSVQRASKLVRGLRAAL